VAIAELLVDAQHGVDGDAGAVRALGEVAGIVPAAVDGLGLARVSAAPILMAEVVYAGDVEAAALTVVETQSLLDGAEPEIVGHREGAPADLAAAQEVAAGGGETGEVQDVELAALVLDGLDREIGDVAERGGVQQLEAGGAGGGREAIFSSDGR